MQECIKESIQESANASIEESIRESVKSVRLKRKAKSVRLKRKAKSIQLKRKGKSVRLKRKEHTQFPNSDSELKGSTRGQKIGTRIPPPDSLSFAIRVLCWDNFCYCY